MGLWVPRESVLYSTNSEITSFNVVKAGMISPCTFQVIYKDFNGFGTTENSKECIDSRWENGKSILLGIQKCSELALK